MKKNYKIIALVFIGFFVLLICKSFNFLLVEGHSMKPTIHKGQYVLVLNKEAAHLIINENDIVIVNRKVENKIYLKRIFSVENDLLSINETSINNSKNSVSHDPIFYASYSNDSLCKSYLKFIYRNIGTGNSMENLDVDLDNCMARTPEHHFFVVGDNYNNSVDSRFWGFIHEDQIIGKVVGIF